MRWDGGGHVWYPWGSTDDGLSWLVPASSSKTLVALLVPRAELNKLLWSCQLFTSFMYLWLILPLFSLSNVVFFSLELMNTISSLCSQIIWLVWNEIILSCPSTLWRTSSKWGRRSPQLWRKTGIRVMPVMPTQLCSPGKLRSHKQSSQLVHKTVSHLS